MRTQRQRIPDAQERFADLRFPVNGIDLTQGFGMQPDKTTPAGVNVRTYEPGTARARGGQRPGFGKYVPSTVNGSNSVQEINYLVMTSGTVPGSVATLPAFYYTTASSIVMLNNWMYSNSFSGGLGIVAGIHDTAGSYLPGSTLWETVKAGALVASGTIPGNPSETSACVCTDGTNFYFEWIDATTSKATILSITPAGVVNYSNTGIGGAITNGPHANVVVSGTIFTIDVAPPSTTTGQGITKITAATGAAGSPYQLVTGSAIATNTYGLGNTTVAPSIAAVGTLLAVPVQKTPHMSPTYAPGLVFVTTGGSFSPSALLNLTAGGTNLPKLASDGTAFYMLVPGTGSTNGYVVKVNTSGSVVWTSASFTGATSSYAIGYNSNTNLVYVSNDAGVSLSLDPATGNSVGAGLGANITAFFDAGTFTSGGETAGGASTVYNRKMILIAVAGGQLKTAYKGTWHTPGTITGTLSSSVPVIRSSVFGGKLYLVDGSNYTIYDPGSDSVIPWVASAGAMPVGALGGKARLICTWRGRLVLSGLYDDALNWFAAAVDAPTNFDYSPLSVSPTQAIAGSNGPQGKIKDAVTCLMPFSDDILFIGCDHSLWKFQGDPMEGGRIDNVSEIIGVAFGSPWLKDPYGNIYFLSNRCGIYQMTPGAMPQRISQQVEQLLQTIAMDSIISRFLWDDRNQGLHVFITHYSGAQAESHLFWEQRTNCWFQESFTNNNHNPLCCVTFDGNTPDDRVPLMGSWDGYVRYWSNNLLSDDGVNIASSVTIGPLLTPDLDDVLFKDLQAVLGTGGGAVNYSIFVGASAEAALANPAVATGVWQPGRNYNAPIRRSGHAIWVQLSSTSYWALEQIRARIASTGKVRRRGL